jgi:hypothetical protein
VAHCMHLLGLLSIFGALSWRVHMWRHSTCYFGVDHFFSCGVLHLVGTLHIHPWSWLPWDSHMWIGCMHLVDHLLFWDGCYGAFS